MAVTLQLIAVVLFIAGMSVLAGWGGFIAAVAVPLFAVGVELERRH